MSYTWLIKDTHGTFFVIENVDGADVFNSELDRPIRFVTSDGVSHKPKEPTVGGKRHEFDNRDFRDREDD